ncbi:hypothetical protein N7519_003508 [Penicillium mononematosum]|uniref:uncharacterized protein n=1 Tax=Penicillium mononematosum TaxID=268346 RepID=UPI0025479852|nr:uncharacterized protein N7519_003508 [Penicillium mononematosum]KAJ6188600.1 hypothetical protein N7519_003508 [Penicillium mononematosum]
MPLNHAQHWTQEDDPWQGVELATGIPDDGSQPQDGHNTQWIYPLLRRAGCIQPQKALESTSGAPLLFCLSLRLTAEIPSPILSDPHTGSHSVGLFWSRDMKVNGDSRTLPTRAFGRRQIVEVNATFGAGQQKTPLSTFCQAYGDWSTGQLILTCSRPNRPMATVSRDALAEYPGESALELVRSPCTLEPLYNSASAYYWDARKEQRHLPMHNLATCSDRLAARQPSEYDLDLHGVAVDQKYVRGRAQSSHGGYDIACGNGHHYLNRKSLIGLHC